MKILLCQVKRPMTWIPMVPYAQLTLAAHIEDIAEVQVSGVLSDGIVPLPSDIMKQIKEFNPEVVGISVVTTFAASVSLDLAKSIKEYNPEIIVIGGGHHATFAAPELLRSGWFDAIFLGEGEVSLRDFVIKKDFRQVPGVAYIKNSEMIKTGPAPLISLDELKPPAYRLLPKKPMMIGLGIESSRGCLYNCDFCAVRQFFGTGRMRKMSPEHFIENLKQVVEETGGGVFFLSDDTFTAHMKGHVQPICEALIAESLPVSIAFRGRVDNLLQHIEMIPLLVRAGFRACVLGVESIHPEILKAMKKGSHYGREEIKRLISTCEDNGMAIYAFTVYGYPNQTPEMILETVDFLISLNVSSANMLIVTPLPGSRLYERSLANNDLLSRDYNLYDGFHRILRTIPETTPDLVAYARRRFYLRPEHIKKMYENVLDSSKVGIQTFMPTGHLCANVSYPMMARPRTADEWVKLIEGLNMVLRSHLASRGLIYNSTIRLRFDSINLFLTIENGLPTCISTDEKPFDLEVEMDIETVIDLSIRGLLDILSAFVMGKVQTPKGPLEKILEFIVWFTEAQKVLRWAVTMKEKVPVLRSLVEDWIRKDEERSRRFEETFGSDATLFIGSSELGGLIFHLTSGKNVTDVTLSREYPKETNFQLLIEPTELEEIFGGGLDTLYELLDSRQVRCISAQAPELIQPQDFFDTLPGKFRPERAVDLDIVIQYRIQGEGGKEDKWWIMIRNEKLSVGQESAPFAPNVTLKVKTASFLELINGRKNPLTLLAEKDLFLEGNPFVMLQTLKCFDNLSVKEV